MSRMYQEGGLQDDGARVEPVTGNEVPSGSMDQEVRDDIPAQLSEGEYVVPADVVRYYGVRFFEDLRGKAKEDFARMEAEGRVGGEPVDPNGVPMEQDEELTPEEMQMLQEALGQAPTGMYMGGMVPQQRQAMYNPYQQQQTQYSLPNPQPMFQTKRTVGMQEGGDVSGFNPSDWSLTGSFSDPFSGDMSTGSGGMQLKEYINIDTGQTRMITVLNGKPIGMVPEGFVPATEEAKQQAQDKSTEVDTKTDLTRTGGDRGPGEDFGSRSTQDDTAGYSGPLSGNVAKNIQEQIESAGKFSGIGGLAGGLIGALVGLPGLAAVGKTIGSNISESASVGDALETAALADIMGYSDLSAKGLSKAKELAKDFDIDLTDDLMSKASSKALAEFNNAVDAAKSAGLSREAFGSDEAFGRAMEATAPAGMSVSRDSSGAPRGYTRSAAEAAPTTSPRPPTKPSNLSASREGRESSVSDTVEGAIAGMADKGFGSAPSSGGGRDSGGDRGGGDLGDSESGGFGGMGTGGLYSAGGLVSRPNKTKKQPANKRKKPYKNRRSGLGSK